MSAELVCFNADCSARYPIDEVIYECRKCGGLIEVENRFEVDPRQLTELWDRRAASRDRQEPRPPPEKDGTEADA